MKVLCTCVPARSRFEILAPLASELLKAGHEVIFAVPVEFSPLVELAGFSTISAGLTIPQLLQKLNERPDVLQLSLPPDEKASLLFTEIAPRQMIIDLKKASLTCKFDLLLHEEGEYSGPLFAAMNNLPCFTIGWPVAMRSEEVLKYLSNKLKPLWNFYNQAFKDHGGLFKNFIDTCPSSMQNPNSFSPPNPWKMKLQLFDGYINHSSEKEFEIETTKPIVHVTFGTVLNFADIYQILKCTSDGLKNENIHLIATVSNVTQHEIMSLEAENIVVYPYIPHSQLLPFCSLVICHGGPGTTIAALANGIPLIIIPQGGASQFRNAYSCFRLGVAQILSNSEVTSELIGTLVKEMISNPKYKISAQEIRDEIQKMPDTFELVCVLEQFVLDA